MSRANSSTPSFRGSTSVQVLIQQQPNPSWHASIVLPLWSSSSSTCHISRGTSNGVKGRHLLRLSTTALLPESLSYICTVLYESVFSIRFISPCSLRYEEVRLAADSNVWQNKIKGGEMRVEKNPRNSQTVWRITNEGTAPLVSYFTIPSFSVGTFFSFMYFRIYGARKAQKHQHRLLTRCECRTCNAIKLFSIWWTDKSPLWLSSEIRMVLSTNSKTKIRLTITSRGPPVD